MWAVPTSKANLAHTILVIHIDPIGYHIYSSLVFGFAGRLADRFALGTVPLFGAATSPGFGLDELLGLAAEGALICLRGGWHGRW